MRTSVCGLANHHGLLLLIPEEQHAAPFLLRRAERANAVCFWVVVDDEDLRRVQAELHAGYHSHALMLLQIVAIDIGRILPSDSSKTAA